MSLSAKITEKEGCLVVSGNLNFSSVVPLLQLSLPLFEKKNALHFDFAKVTFANSAGLALLLEWKRYAIKHAKPISFKNLPQQLLSIAVVAGIDKSI